MVKQFWVSLPVKDIQKSKEFFSKLGFTKPTEHGNTETSAGLQIGEKGVVVMLFHESVFKGFTQSNLVDTQQGTEALFSIDAESRAEVDELAKKAEAAGGIIFGKPAEHSGWMYGCGFSDLDGHKWNVLFMDFSKMPK
jgi:uncharacterized protein